MNLVERLRDCGTNDDFGMVLVPKELRDEVADALEAALRVATAARKFFGDGSAESAMDWLSVVASEPVHQGVADDAQAVLDALAAYARQNPDKPHSRSQAIRFAVQRGEPVPSFDKENPDSAQQGKRK